MSKVDIAYLDIIRVGDKLFIREPLQLVQEIKRIVEKSDKSDGLTATYLRPLYQLS